ncbi:MAG: hypothetical protein GF317_08910 [Candidatus Lokiarchaeota archaeon]|nr:hypothetical protein [Candidatus Lokiarchaeota archaeon]MBD3199831.1 hypothetical protein [Candidatus Lokiarchaeota archaeon]
MKIHSLFILKNNGACIYSRDFTDEIKYNVNLISGFFSAIFTFSKSIISRKLEVLEMGGLRFVFKIRDELIFVILCDSTASILFVSTRLKKISDVFFNEYDNIEKIKDYEEIENQTFEKTVESIIAGQDEIFKSKSLYSKIIDLFKDLIFQNEILGAAVLSTNGNIIYSSLPNDIMVRSLKELEIRFMTGAMALPEMFYSLENGQKVFSQLVKIPWKSDSFLIVLLFDKTVPLGMAELQLNRVGKKIVNIV